MNSQGVINSLNTKTNYANIIKNPQSKNNGGQ